MSKPGKSLKGLCKKLGVRLTVKKGKKRVYKSVKVLKAQCSKKKKKVTKKRKVTKRKVTKKRKVRRRRKFGVALTPQQRDMAAGYNLRNIQFFSDNLMNGSHNNIMKMLTMITPHLHYDPHFASRPVEYLIHNHIFRKDSDVRTDDLPMGVLSQSNIHFSQYLLLNYNNKVRLESGSIGPVLIGLVQADPGFYNLNNPNAIRNISNLLTKKWLLKNKTANDQQDWIQDKTFIIEAPNGLSIAKYSNTEQQSRGNSPNPYIPLDEMIHKLNDDDLRAYKFFVRDHMKLYQNYAAERASDKYTDLDRAFMDNHIQFLDRGFSPMFGWIDNYPIIVANGNRVALETFLTRILDELILIKHRTRVMASNNNFNSNNICKNVKEQTNSEVRNNLPGRITYNVVNPFINLCSCQDFYYQKFPTSQANDRGHPQLKIKNRYSCLPNIPERKCKHLRIVNGQRGDPSGDDNFTWGPAQTHIYTADLLRQIRDGINDNNNNMMYDDNNNNNNNNNNNAPMYDPGDEAPVADNAYLNQQEIRRLEIMRRRQQATAIVQRNIVNNTRGDRQCYLCFSKPLFLIQNCTGCDRRDRSILCGDSLICLGCIKNYPNNWRDNRIVNYRTKCGIGRGRLNNQKISDIENLRRFISVEEFNELSGTNAYFFQQLPNIEVNPQEEEETERRRATRRLMRELPRGGFFGKRKKKSSIPMSLKKVCKRLKIRLTTKRKGKRVYKSVKVLKALCKKALKKVKKRKSKAGKKVKKKRKKRVKKRKVKKRKVKKRKVKKRKVKKKRVKRRRKFGRNPTPSVTKAPVINSGNIGSISGNPGEYQKYRSYKGSSSTYGF